MRGRLWAWLAIAILVAVIALLWRDARDREQERVALEASLQALHLRLERLEQEQEKLAGELKALRETSVRGVVDQANEAILEGWQALVDTVERQLRAARAGRAAVPPVAEEDPAGDAGDSDATAPGQ